MVCGAARQNSTAKLNVHLQQDHRSGALRRNGGSGSERIFVILIQLFKRLLAVLSSVLTQAPAQLSTVANLSGAFSHVSDQDPKRKLDDLDAKLSAYKAGQTSEKAHQEEHYSQANIAWRMVTEMVAGLGIGFGIGYGLDVLLGTTPFLMVLFTLLGIAAGINVMMRSAAEIQKAQEARQAGSQDENGADRSGDEG